MQLTFDIFDSESPLSLSEENTNGAEWGEVYTRPEVVDFIVALAGLDDIPNIKNVRILEPSCGVGHFVLRLAKAMVQNKAQKPSVELLLDRIQAYELSPVSLAEAKNNMVNFLTAEGYQNNEVQALVKNWFIHGDFLEAQVNKPFTHIVGNPPYIRIENIPKTQLLRYREQFQSMGDRADIYIPFFEKSLSLLEEGGKLCFICTDRWMKNRYGRHLRNLVAQNYSFDAYVDMNGYAAFEEKVSTYPAITLLGKPQEPSRNEQLTAIVPMSRIDSETGHQVQEFLSTKEGSPPLNIQFRKNVVRHDQPWLLNATNEIDILQKLEAQFPTLEEAECQVLIGAATGCNRVYIVEADTHPIEESRLLPVITANELKHNQVEWKGRYLINTYDEDGVIDLGKYPLLQKYLESHKEQLSQRHVAKKAGAFWYKTIDRVYPERARREKLLIPDIKSEPVVLYDSGQFHPNNSIYYIVSDSWNLYALRAILISGISKLFIGTYSTKVMNGYLRFQAQHLRKIRIPYWQNLNKASQESLNKAGQSGDVHECNQSVATIFGLTQKEKELIASL